MTGFSIADFSSSINSSGVLRDNSFLVSINAPPILTNYSNSNAVRDLSVRCSRVNIPGINLATQDIMRYGYGPVEKVPYSAFFNDITADFITDRNASSYTFFNLWMNGIIGMDMQGGMLGGQTPRTNSLPYEMSYKSEYVTRVFIFVYNDKSEKVIEVTLEDAWPIALHDTPLSWSNQDDIIRAQVTFNYRSFYMKTLNVSSLPGPALNLLKTPDPFNAAGIFNI